jgi:transposase
MLSVNKNTIPIWIEALSANSNDKKAFRQTVKKFQRQFLIDKIPSMVLDSAFYARGNITGCGDGL